MLDVLFPGRRVVEVATEQHGKISNGFAVVSKPQIKFPHEVVRAFFRV